MYMLIIIGCVYLSSPSHPDDLENESGETVCLSFCRGNILYFVTAAHLFFSRKCHFYFFIFLFLALWHTTFQYFFNVMKP